jgi:broad specificity phosphatase PhoE
MTSTTSTRNEIVLVRHGETEWSRSGQHTGRTDLPLTENGRLQAAQLGKMLRGRDFVLAMSSPLARAVETSQRSGINTHVEISKDLLEWDYGIYEGLTTAEIQRSIPGWSVWTHSIIGGESAETVGARADLVIDRALAAPGDTVLFSHGHLLRILAARWLSLPARDGSLFALDTATVSTLGFERENRVIDHWNKSCDERSRRRARITSATDQA